MFTTHPSMTPGAIIGYRKSGVPIRLLAGGAGEGADGDGSTSTGQDGTTSGDAGAGAGQQTGQEGGTGGTGGRGDTGTGHAAGSSSATAGDDSAARTIAAVREDFKSERAKRQAAERRIEALEAAAAQRETAEAERNRKLAIALGVAADEPPDPEKLAADLKTAREQTAAEVTRREARERELLVELETRRHAGRHGADPDRLADSRSFMAQVAKLDPASDSFSDDLADAIKKAVETNPALKTGTPAAAAAGGTPAGESKTPPANQSATTAPPARSGGEHNGAAGGNRQWTQADVDALPKNREGGRRLQEAIDAGLLVDLGFGPRKSRR